MDDGPLLTVRKVAVRLKVKEVTASRWLTVGRLRGAIISDWMGGSVPASDIERFLANGFAAGMPAGAVRTEGVQ